MTYSAEKDRWLVDMEGYSYGLHCGDLLNMLIDGAGIPCRIEYDCEWYVIMPGARFNLRDASSYMVAI